jgi:hypothetical protein
VSRSFLVHNKKPCPSHLEKSSVSTKCPPSTQETLSNPSSQVICVYKCPPPP